MKWPETLAFVRHGESAYNTLGAIKDADPAYQAFKKAYGEFEESGEHLDVAQELARVVIESGICALDMGDHDTPLTDLGWWQAEETGKRLPGRIALPNVILVSPYDRTHQTVDGLIRGWPELADIPRVEDDRLREQEHGLSILYGDWRLFQVMHPEQERLRKKQGEYWYQFPQGENVPMVRDRLRSIQNTLTREYSGQVVLTVAHHLTKLAFRANMERLGAKEFSYFNEHEKPINCGVTIYQGNPNVGSNGRLELQDYNLRLYPEIT